MLFYEMLRNNVLHGAKCEKMLSRIVKWLREMFVFMKYMKYEKVS